MTSRPAELLRNLMLGLDTAVSMAAEDPGVLMIQAARRAPAAVRQSVSRALLGGGRAPLASQALGSWLAGHDDQARIAVAECLRLRSARPGPLRTLLAEVGVLLDVPGAAEHGSRATRARAALRRGEMSDAAATAGMNTRLGARLASERQAMTPGRELRERPFKAARAPGTPGEQITALHLLTNSVPHTSSGYALRSHQVLRAQHEAGIGVRAMTRVGYPISVGLAAAHHHDVIDGVPYDRLIPWRSARTPGARLQQNLELAREVMAATQPRVLHTTTNYTNALITRALSLESGVPWVYEVRGILEDTWVASFPVELREAARASEKFALLRARETELMMAADRVVTLGETVKADLVERGVAAHTITVAPNAVASDLLTRNRPAAQAREALGLPSRGFWVGTVSSLVAYEGIHTLIGGVAQLRAQGHDVRAAIVGDGAARPQLERLAQDLGVSEHVIFTGRVPSNQAADWYEALDVFALPRVDSHVTRTVVPLKPMQAMALGRPLIASDLPALAEVVDGPGAGLLVEPDSVTSLAAAIERLEQDPALCAQLSEAGRAFAATRTWESVGSTYRAMYEAMA